MGNNFEIDTPLVDNDYIRILIDEKELDLDKTFTCGQVFNWEQHNNGVWSGVINNSITLLRQGKFKDGKYGILTNIHKDETGKLDNLINYLDLNMNYIDEVEKLNLNRLDKEYDTTYLEDSYHVGMGIHILRQDLFQTIITFMLSQFNNMHNIRLTVQKLSQQYGKRIETIWLNETYIKYTFPSYIELKDLNVQDYKNCSLGLRSEYIYKIVQIINNNPKILDDIANSDYNKAIEKLTKFKGIGSKVANCITLFSLHHVQSFPIDVHIQRIINTYFKGDYNIQFKLGDIAGIIQQYMFYYKAVMKNN